MLKLTPKGDLTLSKREPFFSKQLCFGLLCAALFHAAFFSIFKIRLHTPDISMHTLSPICVSASVTLPSLETDHILGLCEPVPKLDKLVLPKLHLEAMHQEEWAFQHPFPKEFEIPYCPTKNLFILSKSFTPYQIELLGCLENLALKQERCAPLQLKLGVTVVSFFRFEVTVEEGRVTHYAPLMSFGDDMNLSAAQNLLETLQFEENKMSITGMIDLILES